MYSTIDVCVLNSKNDETSYRNPNPTVYLYYNCNQPHNSDQNSQMTPRKSLLNIDEMASTHPRMSSRDHSGPSTPGLTRRLPLPWSPGSSWQIYRDRVEDALLSKGVRTAVAFFIFGLMNNILYVIFLSVICPCF